MRGARALLVGTGVVVLACSSATSSSSSGGAAALFASCPATPPANGDVACEYGGDPDSRCNTVALCVRSKSPMNPQDLWSVSAPDPASRARAAPRAP